jgi:hypothetical protein
MKCNEPCRLGELSFARVVITWIRAVDQGRGSNGQSESDGIEQLELG